MSTDMHVRFCRQPEKQGPTRHRLPPPCRRLCPPLLQTNEQRFRLLEGKHTALVAEKDKLFQENETLRQVRRCDAADLAQTEESRQIPTPPSSLPTCRR